MIVTPLLCAAIALGPPGPATPDAESQVRMALRCESLGRDAERIEHLERAVRDRPSDARARGLLGLVFYRGKWMRPEEVARERREDQARLAVEREYLDRRARTPDRPDDQMKLADWCAGSGLEEAATVHYRAAIRMDPGRDAAWRHLGYRKKGGRWVRNADIGAERREAARQKQADRTWRARLLKLRTDLAGKDPARRDRAEAALDEVTDPRAVPSIWAAFVVVGGPALQQAALRMLGRIEGPSASRAIAAIAVLSPWPEVRSGAIEALRRRDPGDVVGPLIGMVRRPFRYEVRPVPGSEPPGALFVDGRPFDLQQLDINPGAVPLLASGAGRIYSPDVPFDPFGIRNQMVASGVVARNQLTMTPHGIAPSGLAPIAPDAAAQAAQAIEADPANASAILSRLQTDPSNRVIPQGYSFQLTDPSYGVPVHEVGRTNVGSNPVKYSPSQMEQSPEFIRQVQAGVNNPLAPMGMAMQLQRLENNPAHKVAAEVQAMRLSAEQMAAQRDIELARELQRVRMAKLSLRQRLEQELAWLRVTNAGILATDARVLPVLKATTGMDFGIDAEKWRAWWLDQLDRSPGEGAPATSPRPTMRAGFAIGTMARTIDGPRTIGSLQPGDRVLGQDPAGGGLAFRPVLAVHRGRPEATLRIKAAGESIEATGLQRFWRVGEGWAMARDLRPGDRLRVLGGTVAVESVTEAQVEPIVRIEATGDGDLFVGDRCLLAHDSGFVPDVPEPFDRPPAAREVPDSPTRSTPGAPR